MNIIKKLFPKYETKAELRQKIAFQNGTNRMPIIQVERDVVRVSALCNFETNTPIENVKMDLKRCLMSNINPFIEYDISDINECRQGKCLVGWVYIAKKIKEN